MIMIIYFVIGNFRGTFSSVNMLKGLFIEMLKGYMLTSRNAESVHGQRKVGNPWSWWIACLMLECTYNVSILWDDVHTRSFVLHLPLLKIIDSGRKMGIVSTDLSMGTGFLWESHGKRPMRWDRHKLLWVGNGTYKYVPWTTLSLSMGMSFLWESRGKRPMGWDGTGINYYGMGMGQITMSHGQPCISI